MTDAKPVFDAIEQFKRDHPEYNQAVEILDRCGEIIAEYQRIIGARQPIVQVHPASTGRPPKRWVTYE